MERLLISQNYGMICQRKNKTGMKYLLLEITVFEKLRQYYEPKFEVLNWNEGILRKYNV